MLVKNGNDTEGADWLRVCSLLEEYADGYVAVMKSLIGAERADILQIFADHPESMGSKLALTFDQSETLPMGAVHRATVDGKDVLVKVTPISSRSTLHGLATLTQIKPHSIIPNILALDIVSGNMLQVFESDITLYDWVMESRERFEQTRLSILKQLASGLQYIHDSGVRLKCLPPQNIYLQLTPLEVKFNCFTHAIVCEDSWQAPERIRKQTYVTETSDIFSLGCLFFFVLSNGKHPGTSKFSSRVPVKVAHKDLVTVSDADDCQEYIALISEMVAFDPTDRPDISKVVEVLNQQERRGRARALLHNLERGRTRALLHNLG
jgi:serine/threonine-protein kinase/endoribonuclease IRE1